MQASERLKCLQKDIDDLVARYHHESVRYKKHAVVLRIISVFLAASITVLLGLKFKSTTLAEWFGNIALFLGAAITVLSAYEAFFDPRALWIRETVTFARLKDLQRDLRFWSAGLELENIDVETLSGFKKRLDLVLEDTLKYWMKLRGAQDLEKYLEAKAELHTSGDVKDPKH